MAGLPPPPTNDNTGSFAWLEWFRQLRNYVNTVGSVPWSIINFAGSSISDIASRSHQNLQSLQGGTTGQYYHLTSAEHTAVQTNLTDGIDATVPLAKLTPAGSDGSLTFTNGVLTSRTDPT